MKQARWKKKKSRTKNKKKQKLASIIDDVIKKDSSPIEVQNSTDDARIREWLNEVDEYSRTRLIKAVDNDDYDRVKYLLELGADPNTKNTRSKTPLHKSIDVGIVQLLVSYGADVLAQDTSGDTPLMCAIIREETQVVQYYMSLGSSVISEMLLQTNHSMYSPLDEAVQCKYKYLEDILQHIPLREISMRSVALAATEGNLSALKLFRQKGFDMKTIDCEGRSLLHYAYTKIYDIPNDNQEVIDYLRVELRIKDRVDKGGVYPVGMIYLNNEYWDP